jgi:predicted TIM-barrel fold metal-dependent hydrolase
MAERSSFAWFRPRIMLQLPAHTPAMARFPVIDAHNHLFGDVPAGEIVRAMDAVGVRLFLNVSGNVSLPFDEKGYTIRRRPFAEFRDGYILRHPGRFAAFTMSDFARWDDFVLFRSSRFVDRLIGRLEEDAAQGALGLKVTKELGLRFRDPKGGAIPVDDPRLSPVWRRAGEMGLPVLIHTADPSAFFLPVDERNEHYATLLEYPGWSFHGSVFSKEELLAQRDRMIAAHPGTTFICPHVASQDEDLAAAARFLDAHPNAYIDLSARIDELGRQPYTARDFMIRYRDRILFGSDMPAEPRIYRCYFRFLETRDEHFDYPDYTGRWGFCRWKIYGLNLPDPVLRRIYYENALRAIPGLQEVYGTA